MTEPTHNPYQSDAILRDTPTPLDKENHLQAASNAIEYTNKRIEHTTPEWWIE